MTLEELLEKYSALPADGRIQLMQEQVLNGLKEDDLTALREKAASEFGTLSAVEINSVEDVDGHISSIEFYADLIDAANSAMTYRKVQADRLSGAVDRVAAATKVDEPATVEVVDAPVEVDAPAEPSRELVTAGATATQVVAAPAAYSVGSLPSSGKPPTETPKRKANIFAASGLSDHRDGAAFEDPADLAKAVISRLKNFPSNDGAAKNTFLRNSVAVFRRDEQEDYLTPHTSEEAAIKLFDKVSNERNLEGNSLLKATKGQALLAAGGWCAPSETHYELCDDLTSMDGIVDLPTLLVKRGGIRYPSGVDFAAVYANTSVGAQLTEAQVIAGTAKTCTEVPCPSFLETRLGVVYSCITSPLLTATAYPELVADFISRAQKVQAHKVNASVIASMVAAATPVDLSNVTSATVQTASTVYDTSAMSNILEAVSLIGAELRSKYRLAQNQTIEAVFPDWAPELIRTDLARRNGVEAWSVSDEQIMEAFRVRKIRPQFVYDWQLFPTSLVGLDWAQEMQVLVYVAGTFTKLTADVVELDTIYDNAMLKTNSFTALFQEEGLGVISRCYASRVVTVSTAPTGTTGLQNGQLAPPA